VRPLVVGVVIASVIGLTGWAVWYEWDHEPTSGVVVHKQHSDSYWYPTTSCGSYDSKMNCTSYTTHMNYMPDSWQLCIRGTDRHGRPAEDCIEVSKGSWFSHPEGSQYGK